MANGLEKSRHGDAGLGDAFVRPGGEVELEDFALFAVGAAGGRRRRRHRQSAPDVQSEFLLVDVFDGERSVGGLIFNETQRLLLFRPILGAFLLSALHQVRYHHDVPDVFL